MYATVVDVCDGMRVYGVWMCLHKMPHEFFSRKITKRQNLYLFYNKLCAVFSTRIHTLSIAILFGQTKHQFSYILLFLFIIYKRNFSVTVSVSLFCIRFWQQKFI